MRQAQATNARAFKTLASTRILAPLLARGVKTGFEAALDYGTSADGQGAGPQGRRVSRAIPPCPPPRPIRVHLVLVCHAALQLRDGINSLTKQPVRKHNNAMHVYRGPIKHTTQHLGQDCSDPPGRLTNDYIVMT